MKHSPSGNHIRDAAAQELENTDPETLSSWILTQQHLRAPDAKGNLTQLLNAISVGCKFVASAVRKVLHDDCSARRRCQCQARLRMCRPELLDTGACS